MSEIRARMLAILSPFVDFERSHFSGVDVTITPHTLIHSTYIVPNASMLPQFVVPTMEVKRMFESFNAV